METEGNSRSLGEWGIATHHTGVHEGRSALESQGDSFDTFLSAWFPCLSEKNVFHHCPIVALGRHQENPRKEIETLKVHVIQDLCVFAMICQKNQWENHGKSIYFQLFPKEVELSSASIYNFPRLKGTHFEGRRLQPRRYISQASQRSASLPTLHPRCTPEAFPRVLRVEGRGSRLRDCEFIFSFVSCLFADLLNN